MKLSVRGGQNKEVFTAAIHFHLSGLDLHPAAVRK